MQVEVEFARNAFDNILRNKTLEDLYEANGRALGMEFTADEEVLRNASGEVANVRVLHLRAVKTTRAW